MTQPHQSSDGERQISQAIAGLATLGGGVCLGAATIVWGQQLISQQISHPLIGGVLRPLNIGGSVLLILVVMLFGAMILLGVITSFAEPSVIEMKEYSLLGLGGMVGTSVGIAVSLAGRVVAQSALPAALPADVGGSMTALALVAVPVGIIYHSLWRPESASMSPRSQTSEDPPDPEIVRKQRTVWADDADPKMGPAPMPTLPDVQQHERIQQPEQQEQEPSPSAGLDSEELEFQWVTETEVDFDDIGGMDDLKRDLETDVIKPLTTGKEKAEKLDIPLPNILFHGPPGTGKTFTAKALATELGLPFAKLSGSDVQTKWINESAQKINQLFTEAKQVAECEGGAVVFLDEIDSVMKRRSGAGRSHEEDNKVVAEFLNHLQETGEHDVVFIGATNRLDALDEAGIRSGRIDKTIEIGTPDTESRAAIIRAQLRDRPTELNEQHIRVIAKKTAGCTGADLESMIIQAARNCAYHRDGDHIRWEDFKSLDKMR